jgi:hypothetical protein
MPADAFDFYPVSYSYRTIGDEKYSGQQIGHSFLGRKTQGDSCDTGSSQERSNLDPIDLANYDGRDKKHDQPEELFDKVDQPVIEIIIRGRRQQFQPAQRYFADRDKENDGCTDGYNGLSKRPPLQP